MELKLLLVEDDEYKALDLVNTIQSIQKHFLIERVASVTTALRSISAGNYDLVVLDMSLPTFDISGPGGGGSPEGQGGIEVLRLARRLGNASPVIIVTQYPDIDINGNDVSLEEAAGELSKLFGIDVRGCLLYDFDDDGWKKPFREVLLTAGHDE